jgi:CheY-like chemotaxis protein
VRGESVRLKEVFVNIINNALWAMPKGGALEIWTFHAEQNAVVSIRDTGCGMTVEVQRKIFDPFFTTKGVSGTGLGLSEALGIIKQHGGEILVSSQLNQGTTFSLYLPIPESEHIAPESTLVEVSPKSLERLSLLVIDDELYIRELLSAFLEDEHHVDVAANGEEGLESLAQKSYDILITDLGMPGMNGYEVARQAKAVQPHLFVVLMTGWGVQISDASLRENRIEYLLSKPFDLQAVQDIVTSAAEGRKRRR